MSNRPCIAATLLAALAILPAAPVNAAVILITHAKAVAGNVTPGDAAGYPVTISIPGSFQLDSNLIVAANKIGIQVTSKNVTIDLNGFTLEGSDVAFHGITGGLDNVTIRNGTIDSFKFDGIHGAGDRWVAESLQVLDNGRDGIVLTPKSYHRVHDNTVAGNDGTGILCNFCVVSGNVVADNLFGIVASGATVLGNYISHNEILGLSTGSEGSGFAQNTLHANNTGIATDQVSGTLPLHPNVCVDTAC